MLTTRQRVILNILVAEYIKSAQPVGSREIARRFSVGLSPATIRNEMASLGDEGFILRPHTSAGGVPSDKGYRSYVESIIAEAMSPEGEAGNLRQTYNDFIEYDVEEWARMAAFLLATAAGNLGIVTFPKPSQSRLEKLELVRLQEFLALLVLIFRQARVRKQVLHLTQAISQEELTQIANKLTAAFGGLTRHQVTGITQDLSPVEVQVRDATVEVMQGLDRQQFEDPSFEGLRHLLSQPEFHRAGLMRDLVDALESRQLFRMMLPEILETEGLRIIIGEEHKQESLRPFSLVLTQYGMPRGMSGVVAVLGPTRMEYRRSIAAVRQLSRVMSELVSGLDRP